MVDKSEIPDHLIDEDGEVQFGTLEDALIDERNVEREWVKVNERVYWFDMKEISWEKKTEILDEALEVDQTTEEVELNIKKYYRKMLETMIEDMSVDESVPIFLKGMTPEVGNRLQNLVPEPNSMMEEVDEGN